MTLDTPDVLVTNVDEMISSNRSTPIPQVSRRIKQYENENIGRKYVIISKTERRPSVTKDAKSKKVTRSDVKKAIEKINKENEITECKIGIKVSDTNVRYLSHCENKKEADVRDDNNEDVFQKDSSNGKQSLITVSAPKILKKTVTSELADYDRFSRKNRDSWDVLENPLIQSYKQSQTIVEEGMITRTISQDEERKNKYSSWNILDLRSSDDDVELFIASRDSDNNKRNSSDISYLFEKYQRERDALRRMNSRSGGSSSDFSEISSLSDDGGSDMEDSRGQSWYQDCTYIEEPGISHEKALQYKYNRPSAFAPIDYLSDEDRERVHTFQLKTDSVSQSTSPRSQRYSEPVSPNVSQYSSPREIAETVVKPLPSPTKPVFVPEMSMFTDEDLSSLVLAQAASAVRKRRRGGRKQMRNANPCPSTEPLAADVPMDRNAKTSDSGISEDSNISPRALRAPTTSLTNVIGGLGRVSSLSIENLLQHNATMYFSGSRNDDERASSNASTLKSRLSNGSLVRQDSHSLAGRNRSSRNQRANDHASPIPNISTRLSSEDLDAYDTEDFLSESSLVSDPCFDQFEGDIFVYKQAQADNNSSSSGNESFSAEDISSRRSMRSISANKRTVLCGNPPCSKQQIMVGYERSKFVSCQSCFTCYCSRTCRRTHWKEHKHTCFYGQVSSYIRSLIRRCEKDPNFNGHLKGLAVESFNIFGRGCLMINFSSPTEAKLALVSKTTIIAASPIYTCIDNIKRDNRQSLVLQQTLQDYDPEQEFVLNITIGVSKKERSTRNKKSTVVKCARISILSENMTVYCDSLSYLIRTFSLPKESGDAVLSDIDARRFYCREVSFSLKRCGVRLKLDYPDAYEKLCQYVERDVLFLPLVLYGQRDGRNYKCMLYPGAINQSEEAHGSGVLV